MKRNIAIVAGGDSSEIVISLKSAEGIFSFLDKNKYNVYIAIVKRDEWAVKLPGGEHTPIDKNDFSFRENGEVKHFDFAYITIHGTPGEDGRLQGYFDMIGMPYSSCGMFVSALTFNKFACNHYLKGFGVDIARSIHLFKGQTVTDEEVVSRLGLPVFVKPNDGGSSFGVTKVKEAAQLEDALKKAFALCQEVLIETFIDGTELTCGVVKAGDMDIAMPIAEVIPKNEFFDFEAKYDPTKSDEIIPARISPELTNRIKTLSSMIYDILRCEGIIRVDYIVRDDEIFMLEVNTTPGMTSNSFVPKMVRAMGGTLREVLTKIIDNKLN